MPYEATEVSQEELHALRASAASLAEANAFKTVPTNYYKAQGTKHEAKKGPATESHPQGRISFNGKADLYREDKRIGGVSLFVSPQVGRTRNGKLDREFRLYNQLARALYPEIKADTELAALDPVDVMDRFTQYPVGMFVTETFASEPDSLSGSKTYIDAKTDEEAKSLREKGWKPANYVQSVGKVK
jgi:hypothetical protein